MCSNLACKERNLLSELVDRPSLLFKPTPHFQALPSPTFSFQKQKAQSGLEESLGCQTNTMVLIF
jgi:hypothetical protein